MSPSRLQLGHDGSILAVLCPLHSFGLQLLPELWAVNVRCPLSFRHRFQPGLQHGRVLGILQCFAVRYYKRSAGFMSFYKIIDLGIEHSFGRAAKAPAGFITP